MGGAASIKVDNQETAISDQQLQQIKSDEKGTAPSYRSSPQITHQDGRRKSQIVTDGKGIHKIVTWFENSTDEGAVSVGDIVRVNFVTGTPLEGLIVEKLNDVNIMVDFGDHIKECHVSNCTLVVRSDELEIGDKVEMKPEGSALYFVGIVLRIHTDCTCDIVMDGDESDIETGVSIDNIRKLMSKRALAVSRWRKAFMIVRAIQKFGNHYYGEEKDNLDFDV